MGTGEQADRLNIGKLAVTLCGNNGGSLWWLSDKHIKLKSSHKPALARLNSCSGARTKNCVMRSPKSFRLTDSSRFLVSRLKPCCNYLYTWDSFLYDYLMCRLLFNLLFWSIGEILIQLFIGICFLWTLFRNYLIGVTAHTYWCCDVWLAEWYEKRRLSKPSQLFFSWWYLVRCWKTR